MNIDCCKSYVGKQIIGLVPNEEECLYYLVINGQDLGAADWSGWLIDGVSVYTSGYYFYTNTFGNQSLIVSYIGTQPSEVVLDDGFGNLYPYTVEKVTTFGGSCGNVCYQAMFDNGYLLTSIDFFNLGGATPLVTGLDIDDENAIETYINNLLGTTNADVSSIWNGSKYVVTINNAYNLGGLTFDDGLGNITPFNVLPCEITPPEPVAQDLLTLYPGAAAAYSVRKLSSSYTGAALRVRKSSDNTESDIGFDSNGDLDTTALIAFVGGFADGFVTKWYDQSGNNKDGIQTTANDQPRIVSSGLIDIVNLKPAVNFISSDLFTLSSSISGNTDYSCFTVGKRPNAANRLVYFGTSDVTSAPYVLMHFNDGKHYISNRTKYGNYVENTTNQILLSSFNISSNLSAYQNGVSKTLTITAYGSSGDFNQIGRSGIATGFNSTGYIQEIIFYPSDQSANRVAIETDIINYYGI